MPSTHRIRPPVPPVDAEPEPGTAAQVWRNLGRDGTIASLFHGPDVDERYGLAPLRLAALLTDLDARYDLGTTLGVCVQLAAALPLLRDLPGQQALAVRRRAERGETTVALAATDDGVPGSDLTAMTTRIDHDPDTGQWTLHGGKRWITNATTAEYALVLARHRPGTHFTDFSLLLLPLDTPGVRVEAEPTDCFTGSGVGSLRFESVRLSPDGLPGRPGRGLAAFTRRIGTDRLASGLWANALSRRVLAQTRTRLGDRSYLGRTQVQDPAVRQEFAAAVIRQQALQALCARACAPGTAGTPPVAALTATLKAAGAATVDHVVRTCARLRGADAFRTKGLHRLAAEAAMFGVAGGTTRVLRDTVADHADALLDDVPW
ncbi:acyl-CoA dehydrogenase family protein [Streptomyces sp. NPDC003247]|uniref:acyl-CoA dehydrogenase family protein n=1 Tax=Streptomyces sp. NPDC003247 TaxID=3364677 RepID=UPI00368E7F77